MVLPVVDLPHPDSPTNPKVSFSSSSKLMPSTALRCSTFCLKKPERWGKYFFKFCTFKIVSFLLIIFSPPHQRVASILQNACLQHRLQAALFLYKYPLHVHTWDEIYNL